MSKPYFPFLLAGAIAAGAPLLCRAQTATLPIAFSAAQNAALAQLTKGVNTIAAPGLPGTLALFSDAAFPIVAGKTGKNARLPVVAATIAGTARVVAFGHGGYLASANQTADTAQQMDNVLSWVAGGKKPKKVGIYADNLDTLSWLQKRGFAAESAKLDTLAAYDVLVVNGSSLGDGDLAPLQAFLARGGGLVMAATGWGWRHGELAKLNSDFVGNQLLAPYGLVWTLGTAAKTAPNGFKVEPISPLVNAQNALAALNNNATPTPEMAEQLSNTLSEMVRSAPPRDALIMPKLRALANVKGGEVVPSERRPVTNRDALARLTLTLQNSVMNGLPVGAIKAHPAGKIFPGDVPPNAKPVSKTIGIDTTIPDWHSLGLYAAPGVPVTIKLPDGVSPQGLSVRIGSHTDKLWNLDSWKRYPEISRIFPLQAGETRVANPFGGLVYVVVPGKIAAQNVEVTVSGAFAAPLFVKGVSDVNEWKNTIRWAPGPWAEIQADNIILTVPSRSVRDLDDPLALANYYDAGLDAAADLYGISRTRKRPERMVADMQISLGYMHSGYPIMTGLDVEKRTVDLADLKTKFPWGHWHELGHNHQKGEWTFAGTGEVTNNLLPLYISSLQNGEERMSEKSLSVRSGLSMEDIAKRWAKYNAGGRKFADWQNDPFLALQMYIQIQQGFGWEPFKKVFAEYGTLSEAQKPKTQEQKRNQWMVRMSRETGHNLGPFFEKWGVPTSQAARDSIADLPAWMPTFPGE